MRNDAKTLSPHAKAKIEPQLFRRTMGAFATGVTVITVDAGGATHAMTANAFMSGSLEPPLCVISVAKRAHTHAMIVAARRFGINILGTDQQDLAIFFAGKKSLDVDARFQRIDDTPLLQDCAARIAARVTQRNAIVATTPCSSAPSFTCNPATGRPSSIIAAPSVRLRPRWANASPPRNSGDARIVATPAR